MGLLLRVTMMMVRASDPVPATVSGMMSPALGGESVIQPVAQLYHIVKHISCLQGFGKRLPIGFFFLLFG